MFKEKFSELSGAVSGMKLRTKIITGGGYSSTASNFGNWNQCTLESR